MNIRPSAGETRDLDNPQLPLHSGPFRKSFFLPWGCLCPRLTGAALAQPRNTRAMPIDRVAETTSPLPLPPMTATTPMPRCRATPHGCWPSCSRLRTCASEAWRPLLAEGFDREGSPAMLRRLVEAGFLSQAAGVRPWCLTPTGCTCRRCGHEEPPPREGVRPWPRRAAGPQRQGPHRRLQPRLGPPTPPAGPEGRRLGPCRPGRSGRPAVGVSQRPLGRAAFPATRRSPGRPAVPAPPSPRRSRPWSSPACSPGRTASCGSASAAATCSAVSAGAGGSSAPPTPTC